MRDVVIAGGGPVGLFLATELALGGALHRAPQGVGPEHGDADGHDDGEQPAELAAHREGLRVVVGDLGATGARERGRRGVGHGVHCAPSPGGEPTRHRPSAVVIGPSPGRIGLDGAVAMREGLRP